MNQPAPAAIQATIRETISRILTRVNALSAGGPGWTRPSYSDLESSAHALIEEEVLRLGLEVSRDEAGNLFARLRGSDPAATPLYVGSHLDTVSQGGAYDGQAGVAAAMALAACFHATGTRPKMDFVVTVTRAEESVWFPASYIGSRGALGRLTRQDMEVTRADTGQSLAEHMRAQGYDPEAALARTPPPPAQFLEFHIEQGPVLHSAGEPYGLVTAIRGGLRYRNARIDGVWAHSGGAPREGRADAVIAFADLAMAMEQVWDEMLAQGHDLTVTFGRVDAASPVHAMAKVAGTLGFCVDLRSENNATLDEAERRLRAEIARIEIARPGIGFQLGAQSRSQPAQLSEAMVALAASGAARLGHAPRRMRAGGGHDAAAFAMAGWESTMIFIRNWNGSHNPDEAMDEADLALAVEALWAALAP